MGKTVLVLGATGLVGGELVKQLVEDSMYSRVTVIVRRRLSMEHPKLDQIVEKDLGRLSEHRAAFRVETVFCCLGTTIKTAGSREAFRRVDLEYPAAAAQLARAEGARQFAVISSMGASEASSFFYNRVKGEMERRVRELGPPAVYIVRPSLLLGNRQEHRFGEAMAARLSKALPFLWRGPLAGYRPVEAETVAAAMRAIVRQGTEGFRIYENKELFLLVK